MTRRLLTVLGICAALFVAHGSRAIGAPANGPTTAYCTPPNTFVNGVTLSAQPLNQNFSYGATCPGQLGDFWTDGPIYSPSFTYFSTSLNFTTPADTWIVQGQRVYAASSAQTAPINSTTYWYLQGDTASFVCETTNVAPYTPCTGFNAPDSTGVLEYTIVTNSQGITSVTNPALASETINGTLVLSALPSGSCLQTGAGGVIQATGLACGSGSGAIASVTGSGNITASTVSGAVTVSEVNSPTWTGNPIIGGTTSTGTLYLGTDTTASLQRTGTNAFQFVSAANTTLTDSGGFYTGSSVYGPTSAFINGAITGTSLTASALTSGLCVQTTTGGALTTTAGPCLTGTGITAVNGSGNIAVATVSGTSTVSIANAPTFSGAVTASQFNGSGAGITAATIPNNSLVTQPVTSVSVNSPLGTSGGLTPTLSVLSNPGFTGTATATGFSATGALIAGSATAFAPTLSDLSVSRTTSTGALFLGGTSSKCQVDYGVTTGSVLTSGCNTAVTGNLSATSLTGTGLTPGDCVQVTTGGLLSTTSSACGSATSVTAVNGTSPIVASTVSGTVTASCPTCVTGLTGTSNISVGTGTTPSVTLASSPSITGSIGVDGDAAPAHGIQAGTSTTAFTATSGVSTGATNAFVLTSPNCGGTNLVEFVSGSTAEDQFGCNGTFQTGSSTYGGSSASVGGGLGVDTNVAGTSGVTGGVAGTTPFNFTDASNTSATEGFVFNTSTACKATTDTFFNAKVNGTSEFYGDCSGDVYGTSFNTVGTSFTTGQCSICIGQTGVATNSNSGIRIGNAAVATTGVTVISTANSGTVAGISPTVLQITNTANRVLAIDNGGDLGTAGNIVSAGSVTGTSIIDSGLSNGDCVQGGSGGSLTTLAGPCALTNANNFFSASQNVTGFIGATSYIDAGSATIGSMTAGDVGASRSSSTGQLVLGSVASGCTLDYNLTIAGYLNSNCGFNAGNGGNITTTNGAITAGGSNGFIGTNTGYIIAGGSTGPLALISGNLYSSTSTTAGNFVAGGSTHRGILGFTSNTWSFASDSATTIVQDLGSFLAAANTANGPTLAAGDIGASEGVSSGKVIIGGSTSSDTMDYGVTTPGVVTHSKPLAVPNLENTGLASGTVSPLCGANNANESQCANQAPLYATTGNQSKATGTTANTYQQLGSNVAVTTGTASYGANAKWLVTIEELINVPLGSSSEYVYGCIASASTGTVQENSTSGTNTCQTTLTNSIAGGPGFGMTVDSTNGRTGLWQLIKAVIQVASGTTYTASCYVAGSSTTSETVYGYCHAIAAPY